MKTESQYQMLPSEELMFKGIREGDSQTLETVYKSFFPGIKSFVLQNSGSVEEARDLCQEAIIVLYEKLQKSEAGLQCSVKTFLYSVTRNLWLKKLSQKNKGMVVLHEQEDYLLVEDEVSDWSDKEKMYEGIAKAIELLGNPCAEIIRDYYFSKMSIKDIADKHGYNNTDTAKNQKYKCLMRLRRYLTLGKGRQETM
jgi:RNA polymerase sigma factor (sigma-70 family)